YAVPGNLVKRVSDQIIRTGSVRRGWVGMKIEESEPGEVRLLALVPGGPAERAGLLTGDRIVAFDDEPLTSSGPLADGISSTPPGTSVKLGLEREGRRMNISIVLGESPAPPSPPRVSSLAPPAPAPTTPPSPPAPAPPMTFRFKMRAPVLGVDLDVD